MKYPYDTDYQPPFPAIPVIFHNSDEGLSTSVTNALLDTGSDGSLVPIFYLRQILASVLSDTRIRSHWGEWRSAQLFLVDIEVDGLKLPGVFVVGDEQGDEIILGRNFINKLRLLLDGPAKVTSIRSR